MLIKRLTLKKILSFNETTVELGQLNVLIGANAVGKSNLIEAISLLQAAPTESGSGFGSAASPTCLRGSDAR
jgi:AAA15 family ATPase/GTPase